MTTERQTQVGHSLDLLAQTVLLALAKVQVSRELDSTETAAVADMQRVVSLLMDGTKFVQGVDRSARALHAGIAWQQVAPFFAGTSPQDDRKRLEKFVASLSTLSVGNKLEPLSEKELIQFLQHVVAASQFQASEVYSREHVALLGQ